MYLGWHFARFDGSVFMGWAPPVHAADACGQHRDDCHEAATGARCRCAMCFVPAAGCDRAHCTAATSRRADLTGTACETTCDHAGGAVPEAAGISSARKTTQQSPDRRVRTGMRMRCVLNSPRRGFPPESRGVRTRKPEVDRGIRLLTIVGCIAAANLSVHLSANALADDDNNDSAVTEHFDARTAEAWARKGGAKGRMHINRYDDDNAMGELSWCDEAVEGTAGTPGFKFTQGSGRFLRGLPAPTIPFGLDLYGNRAPVFVGDACMEDLSQFVELRSLILQGCQATAAGLRRLSALKNLQELDISNSSLSDSELAEIGKLTSLRWLDLSGNEITGDGLRHLNHLGKLRLLKLCFCDIGDGGFNHLASLTELRELDLSGNKEVTGAGLARFGPAQRLTKLSLSCIPLTDQDFGGLESFRDLTSLDVCDTQLSDAGLVHIAKLTHLRSLDISNEEVTEAGLRHLSGMSLDDLEVGLEWTDVCLSNYLAASSPPAIFDLSNSKVTDESVVLLADCDVLESLDLRGTTISDKSIIALVELPRLGSLDIGSTNATDEWIELLMHSKSLESLCVSHTKISCDGLKRLAGLTTLEEIVLHFGQFTPSEGRELMNALPGIRFVADSR